MVSHGCLEKDSQLYLEVARRMSELGKQHEVPVMLMSVSYPWGGIAGATEGKQRATDGPPKRSAMWLGKAAAQV